MYEFHGWINLAESPSEVDEGKLEQKCSELEEFIAGLDWSSGQCKLLQMNGLYTVIVNARPNRRRSEAEELRELIKLITSEFKGAYGIVHEYDEQGSLPAGRGVFTVNVIKRGYCEIRLDPFLSPTNPVVED